MKFAINYSAQAAELLRNGQIQIDLFKCSDDFPETIDEAGRHGGAYVHFSLNAGARKIDEPDLDRIACMIESSDTPYVNIHLALHALPPERLPSDPGNPDDVERVTEGMLRDIALLTGRFGPQRVILEDPMWEVNPSRQTPRALLEPEFVNRIVDQTGCGLLLDVAHAAISAKCLGMDERDYLATLRTDRLCELHVTGLTRDANGAWSDHFAMREDDWALIEWVIDRIRSGGFPRPWAMTFEYGGLGPMYEYRSEAKVISRQAPRLYELAKSVGIER